ncbi:MAG TPA: (d)CMP kinase [Rhizomicrobium sp.]
MVIAVDGTAASGKGTLAKKLAEHYNFAHLDSGKLYRAVALQVLEGGGDPAREEDAVKGVADLRRNAGSFDNPAFIRNARLLSPEVSDAASKVSAFPGVREGLLQFQRDFAANPGFGRKGAVIDGRDIGTVVCPEAAVKLFVDADPEERARRRWLELKGKWLDAPSLPKMPDQATILAEILERDARDRGRAVAPLKPADDAVLLDTSDLDIAAAFKATLDIVEATLKRRPRG